MWLQVFNQRHERFHESLSVKYYNTIDRPLFDPFSTPFPFLQELKNQAIRQGPAETIGKRNNFDHLGFDLFSFADVFCGSFRDAFGLVAIVPPICRGAA
jgi:hypothetical protein